MIYTINNISIRLILNFNGFLGGCNVVGQSLIVLRFARSVETPMENWNLLSGEQQVRNASELDLMEGTRYLMMGIDVTLPFFLSCSS